MILRSLQGDDQINSFAMSVMECTIGHLVAEGKISQSEADWFLITHICMTVSPDGPFVSWMKRRFGSSDKSKVIIATVPV